MYIRPLYFGSGPNLILSPPSEVEDPLTPAHPSLSLTKTSCTQCTLLVWVTPCGSLYGAGGGPPKAIKAIVVDTFDRAAPLGTGNAKLAGNYAPVCEPACCNSLFT